MQKLGNYLYDNLFVPPVQAGLIFFLVLTVSLGGMALRPAGFVDIGPAFPWLAATSFLLFFAVFNAVGSLAVENLNKYWGQSMVSFLVLGAGCGLLAWGLSTMTIDEAGSYRWIFFVVGFGYLVFLSLLGFMRAIVHFAQREEWNAPRIRKKNTRGKGNGGPRRNTPPRS